LKEGNDIFGSRRNLKGILANPFSNGIYRGIVNINAVFQVPIFPVQDFLFNNMVRVVTGISSVGNKPGERIDVDG